MDSLQDLQVVGLGVRTRLVAALGQAGTTGTRLALMTPPSPVQLCTYHVQETRSGAGAADSVWGWTHKELIQRTEGGKQGSAAGHHGV